MARKARSKISVSTLILVVILVAAGMGGGAYVFKQTSDPYRTISPLDLPAYLDNANSLRGNSYKVEGTVENSLAWSPTKGRLISVIVGDNGVVAIFVPAKFNYLNLQKGQRYQFKVEIGKDGVIEVTDMRKV
ncbi:hypothetical protein SAMN05444156_1754 [Verrucomicrobium sp. GAS474]|uniref:hypothetical protein n=1 Tax=Verrucomicrobium sp. GAS474 TaxID=1882831 RepID=UPI00087DCA49|nr:hypothetical protein [Verrucomicrobium sp. GAS474]SDU06455.1 hypothetical protein SAMN05444156_1754 [Verrucomicrobium sp. GAS474]